MSRQPVKAKLLSLSLTSLAIAGVLGLSGCGGSSKSSITPSVAPALPSARISADTPVASGCTGGSASGQVYANAEVEPFAAVHPGNANILISAWQQDRWSDGGSRALVTAVSTDGGTSWQRHLIPFSRCSGAAAASSGDYERVSDPWVDIGPSGVMYSMALALSGTSFKPGAVSALLASRSTDNGATWSTPATLLRDGESFFNDKNSLTADPTDARYVYAVWDRLDTGDRGPTFLARSVDSGATWEPARIIYTPTVANGISQTIGNRIVVLRDGTLVNMFTTIDTVGSVSSSWLGVMRSTDKGVTWSSPIRVSSMQAVGTKDPQTGMAVRDGAILASIAVGTGSDLWMAWQDARPSGGLRDAIVFARSTDGGQTWSAPATINRDLNVAAFTPSVSVSADGQVGVSYYDFRADTASPATLLTSAWLLTSRDGVTWRETKIWSPFDLAKAPVARGLFLGDYQGLVPLGGDFLSVLSMSSQDLNNRTDIYALKISPSVSAQARAQAQIVDRAGVASAGQALSDQAFAQARHQAIVNTMERRLPGWSQRMAARALTPIP